MKALLKTIAAAAIGGFATAFTQVMATGHLDFRHASAVGATGAIAAVAGLWVQSPAAPKQ
jgi:membrane associated rhomboid family serine protease